MSETALEYQKKNLPEKIGKYGLILSGLGLLWIAAAFIVDVQRAMYNYIIMFMFLVSIGIGSVFLVGLEHLVSGAWATLTRRVSEFLGTLAPLLLLLAIPIVASLFMEHGPYAHWASEHGQHDEIIHGKSPYLNIPFFVIRVVAYFAIWSFFWWLFTRNSEKQDASGDQLLTRRNYRNGAIFTPIFAVTITYSAIDIMMSIEPHWFSTMFGVYYFAGTMVSSLAAAVLISVLLKQNGLMHPRMENYHFYGLGTMMFAFNVFWTYIAFSQVMLIWYANLPEETFWMLDRWNGSWKWVSLFLMVYHFVIPFFVLISRPAKMNPTILKAMSIWLLIAHYVDLYWIVMPSYGKAIGDPGVYLGWMELGFPVFAVGLIMVVFNWRARDKNMVPVKDPKLERCLTTPL